MYYVLEVLYDVDDKINLCFFDLESAREFRDFVFVYMDETGAEDGSGAYWLTKDRKIKIYPFAFLLPKKTFAFLCGIALEHMLNEILKVRMATNNPLCAIRANFYIHKKRGSSCILFSLSRKLPAQQIPQVGDMYRVPKSREYMVSNKEEREGRVIGKYCFNVLKVIDAKDELKRRRKIRRIPRQSVIKINDWMKG